MLSYIDPLLFPDECVVLNTPQGYVYPIFKNGSSSLFQSNFEVVQNISACQVINVLIRDPYERFYSGVSTYIKHLEGDHLDQKTILYFIKKYLFLDRHFCPQFFWLVNLRRFTDAKIKLVPFEEISTFVSINKNESREKINFDKIFDSKLDFYLQYDKVLREHLINQVVSFEEIVYKLKTLYPELYKESIDRVIKICNALD